VLFRKIKIKLFEKKLTFFIYLSSLCESFVLNENFILSKLTILRLESISIKKSFFFKEFTNCPNNYLQSNQFIKKKCLILGLMEIRSVLEIRKN